MISTEKLWSHRWTREQRTAYAASLVGFVQHGAKGIDRTELGLAGFGPREIATLSGDGSGSGDGTAAMGGFALRDELSQTVITDKPAVAVIRRMARVEPTTSDALNLVGLLSPETDVHVSGFVGGFKAQAYVFGGTVPPLQNQPRFDKQQIPTASWKPDGIELSRELVDDGGDRLVRAVSLAVFSAFFLDEDAEMLVGLGLSGKPMGVMADARIREVASGAVGNYSTAAIRSAFENLGPQYRVNGTWICSATAYSALRGLMSVTGAKQLIDDQRPTELLGRPLIVSPFLAALAAGSASLIFGDFSEYIIADRQGVRIQRLPERFAPNLGILPTARVGGQAGRPRAFVRVRTDS